MVHTCKDKLHTVVHLDEEENSGAAMENRRQMTGNAEKVAEHN